MVRVEYVIKTFGFEEPGSPREIVEVFLNEKRVAGSKLLAFTVSTEYKGYCYHLVFEHESK